MMADIPAFDPSQPFETLGGGGGGPPPFDPSKPFEEIGRPETAQSVLGAQSSAAQAAMQKRSTQTLPETMRWFLGEAGERAGQGLSEITGSAPRGQVSPGVTQGQWTQGRGVAIKPWGAPAPGTEVSRARQIAGGASDIIGGASEALTSPVKAFAGVPIERVTGIPVETQSNLVGAATALTPGAAGIVREARLPDIAPVTTSQAELKRASKQLYKRAENLGVEFKQPAVAGLSNDIISGLVNDGFRRLDAPSTWSKIEELQKPAGVNATISDLESIRKALARSPKQEWGASSRARAAIDDYLANIDKNPHHIAVNDHYAGALSDIMKDARANWAAMERGKTLENALRQSVFNSGVSGNLDTKLRQQIKTVLSNAALKNKGGYSADEIAAMEAIVAGKNTTNAARMAGSFAPHGAIRLGAATVFGNMFGGHHLAATAIISAMGKLSKSFGDRQTTQRVERLIDQVRARSPVHQAKPQPTLPSVSPYAGSSGAAAAYAGAPQDHAAGGRAEGGGTDDVNLSPDAALASTMTHYAEQPNQAAPYIQGVKDFTSGGLQKALHLPNNAVGRALQSDAANTAMGVMTPMKGAGGGGWLNELMSRHTASATEAIDQAMPQISKLDPAKRKTAIYRIIERARNPERGNVGQEEEQRQLIMDDTERFFQESADQLGRPLHQFGKTFLPRGNPKALTDRPIHPDVLSAMHGEAGMDAPSAVGRDIHPDVLKAMREEERASGGRVAGELPDAKKHTHEEVGYVAKSTCKKQNCALCWKYIPEGPSCMKVRGPIEAGGWCRRFSRTKP